MSNPKHGDKAQCKHCGKPIEYWDRNPNHFGAVWNHTGRKYPNPSTGQHPNYCDETQAEPS
jgi:hypothetical protein